VTPKIKLYINSEGAEGVFGSGKWQLLNAIHQHGSIQQAAKALGRSYRKAWGDIKQAELGLGKKLVTTNRGGTSGGESQLTEFGSELLVKWKLYHAEVEAAMKQSYRNNLQWIE